MTSTAGSNLSVGPPYDLGIYRNDALDLDEFGNTADSVNLERLLDVGRSTSWGRCPS